MTEFTGERVIPDLVNADLFNEHVARYRFAARFGENAHILDAGCGSGYGTVEFSNAASVTAADISAEAIAYARENFLRPGVRFVNAACEALPFANAAFDLVTAFEVIEHLERWPDLLTEAKRVLKPGGILLVSTPNKACYAEMRAGAGPNPYHSHEFEFEEFRSALGGVFAHVRMWTQNHADSLVFAPFKPDKAILQAEGDAAFENAQFFFAACSQSAIAAGEIFAWLPSTGNVLRDRERHIAKLEGELTRKDAWLKELQSRHNALHAAHEKTVAELKERALWMGELSARADERDAFIGRLQAEAEERLGWLRDVQDEARRAADEIVRLMARQAELEGDVAARTEWARHTEAQLAIRTEHVAIQSREIEEYIGRLGDQARQIERQAEELRSLEERMELIAQSKWIRLGRAVNLGPVVDSE